MCILERRNGTECKLQGVMCMSEIVVQCCVCGKFRSASGKWKLERDNEQANAAISHTYCPGCELVAWQESGLPIPERVLVAAAAFLPDEDA